MRRNKILPPKDFTNHTLYVSNIPNDMSINDFFMSYGKYGEIQRIKLLKQYYSSEKYSNLEVIEYFGGVAILLFADQESRTKCLDDQKNHPFIINENVLISEKDNKSISNYYKRCGFLFFSSAYITITKLNQIFKINEDATEYPNKINTIKNIEILYPAEFQRPGMAIIEFSTEDFRNKINEDFNLIQSIIDKERNSNSKQKKNPNDINYISLLLQEKSKEAGNKKVLEEFDFDINFIMKHVLTSNEEFSFCLPSPEFEDPGFNLPKRQQSNSDDDDYYSDDEDNEDKELIPSIIHLPDRKLCNNPIQFQRWFDFEIEYRKISFKVNSLLASQFSNTIKEQLSSNQIASNSNGDFNRYFYSMRVGIEGDFQLIIDSLMGQRIIITAENAIFLLLCSRELQMEQLSLAVHQLVSDLTDTEMVIQFCNELCTAKSKDMLSNRYESNYAEDDDELIDFYADFFSQNFFRICELSSFKSLPIDAICKTLDKLVYEKKNIINDGDNNKHLSNWILEFFEKNDNSRVRLIPYMNKFLKQFNRAQLTSILSKPGANMNSLRDPISQLISQLNRAKNAGPQPPDINNNNNNNDNADNDLVPIIDDEEEMHECLYDENSPTTSGVFAYIKSKYGSIAETVEITSPSCFQSLVDYQIADQHYSSPSIENMWIQFDFKKHPFIINAYTLRSIDRDNFPHHLKNWVIEGSNSSGDNSVWIELDRVENSMALNAKQHYNTFLVKNNSESYRYIRLRQINSRQNSAEQLILRTIEFYGTFINQDEKGNNILYTKGKEWLGIFNYLMKKYRQNPVNREVQVSSAADASNLVNPEWSNMHGMWKSANVEKPYIKFDFNGNVANDYGGFKIKTTVEKYLLKTSMAASYPRSWMVEGSNDGVNWTIIDDVKNNKKISKVWESYVFSCSNHQAASIPFSQIRIRLTAPNSKNTNFFYLSYVELYGKVTISQS